MANAASFSDLYPERRGGAVSPSVFQRATGTYTPYTHRALARDRYNAKYCGRGGGIADGENDDFRGKKNRGKL